MVGEPVARELPDRVTSVVAALLLQVLLMVLVVVVEQEVTGKTQVSAQTPDKMVVMVE